MFMLYSEVHSYKMDFSGEEYEATHCRPSSRRQRKETLSLPSLQVYHTMKQSTCICTSLVFNSTHSIRICIIPISEMIGITISPRYLMIDMKYINFNQMFQCIFFHKLGNEMT